MDSLPSDRPDVIVVGGGPAGATAAGLLALAGHEVVIFEREIFPRFHIGESLLPASLPLFERLGFDVESVPGLTKRGADFVDERQGKAARFAFADGLEGTPGHAWQVERSIFDAALLKHVEGLGVVVRPGVEVRSVSRVDGRMIVETSAGAPDRRRGTLDTRFVVDASGRDRLMCKQERSFQRVEGLGRAAVWTHFHQLAPEAREELEETGNIIVLILDKGWCWVIPLAGGRLSVGLVSAHRGVVSKGWFDAEVGASPLLQRLTAGARRGELMVVGDYSYANTAPRGAGWACIGDAGGFLDPVFSSGVALALAGAEKLAELLSPALTQRREGEVELMAPLETHLKHAYRLFDTILRRFYQSKLVDNFFFYDSPDATLRAGLISILAGDVWRDDNAFQRLLLRQRPRGRAAASG